MSFSKKKLIVESYLNNELRELKLNLPNDLYIIVSKYYSTNRQIIIRSDGSYLGKVIFVGDSRVGKSEILLRFAVYIINVLINVYQYFN